MLLKKEAEYEIDDVVICKEYFNMNGFTFNVNFRFKIICVDNRNIRLQNIKTMETQTVSIDVLRDKFIYSYCYTAHSCQGCSIDDNVIIYDWTNEHATKEWFYVACTRARDLNKVRFYRY